MKANSGFTGETHCVCRQQFFNSSFLQDTFNDGSQIKCFMSVEVNGESRYIYSRETASYISSESVIE